jgi:hypothetical protein
VVDGHAVDIQRIENSAGAGHPDVEGCIDGLQVWIELKSNLRPKRPGTPIRPKCRDTQAEWHERRAKAGCRINWVLIQVGEARSARLYLIPGHRYSEIKALPENELELLSYCHPLSSPAEVLLIATRPWSM